MNPQAQQLQERTRRFAARVIHLCESLPPSTAAREISEQLIDSAGSTDSNYRAACRARSMKEFIAKMGVAAEEADESKGWLELLLETNITAGEPCTALVQEADELTRIFVKSRKTAEANLAIRDATRKRRSQT